MEGVSPLGFYHDELVVGCSWIGGGSAARSCRDGRRGVLDREGGHQSLYTLDAPVSESPKWRHVLRGAGWRQSGFSLGQTTPPHPPPPGLPPLCLHFPARAGAGCHVWSHGRGQNRSTWNPLIPGCQLIRELIDACPPPHRPPSPFLSPFLVLFFIPSFSHMFYTLKDNACPHPLCLFLLHLPVTHALSAPPPPTSPFLLLH